METLKIRKFLMIILIVFIVMIVLPLDKLFFVKYLRKSTWISIQSNILQYFIPVIIIVFHQIKSGKSLKIFFNITKFNVTDILLANISTLLLATGLMCILLLSIINVNGISILNNNENNYIKIYAYEFYLAVFIAPFFEEVIFRGYLLERMSEKWGKIKAIFICALLFGIMHGFNFISAFLIGILFAIIRYKYNSLFPIIIAHMLNNMFVITLKDIILKNNLENGQINFQLLFQNYWLSLLVFFIICLVGVYLILIFFKNNKKIIKEIKSN